MDPVEVHAVKEAFFELKTVRQKRTDTGDDLRVDSTAHDTQMNGPMKLLTGSAHPALAMEISALLNMPLVKAEVGRFADGEINIRIMENVRGGDVFIIQPTCNPVSDHLMEILCLIDACRRASASRITCVMPYFAYARRDRIQKKSNFGNVTQNFGHTPRLIANLLSKAGCNRVITVDVMGQIQGMFNIPVDHLSALPVLAEYFLVRNLHKPCVLAPNIGSTELARGLAERMGAGLAIMDKRYGKEMVGGGPDETKAAKKKRQTRLVGTVQDCDTVIVKDSIDSGKNLARAVDLVKNHGARSVWVAAVHPCFSNPDEAAEMITASGMMECVVANTTPLAEGPAMRMCPNVKVLSVGKLLAQAILRIHNNASVTVLFAASQAKFSKLERKNLSLSMEDIAFHLNIKNTQGADKSEDDTDTAVDA